MSHQEDKSNDIQRLLGCKRYEQPPPGYFASFSDKVIARIESEDGSTYSSWWSWFVERFDAKPVLVCAYGLAVSCLLFTGFRLSQVFEAEVGAQSTLAGPWLAVTPGSPLLSIEPVEPVSGAEASSRALFPRSTSTDLLFPASSFHIQPAGFTPAAQ
jgi:hypothetical protein